MQAASQGRKVVVATFEQLSSRLGLRPLIRNDGTPKGFYLMHHAVRIDFKRDCPDRIQGSASIARHGPHEAFKLMVGKLEESGRLTESEKIMIWKAINNFYASAVAMKGCR